MLRKFIFLTSILLYSLFNVEGFGDDKLSSIEHYNIKEQDPHFEKFVSKLKLRPCEIAYTSKNVKFDNPNALFQGQTYSNNPKDNLLGHSNEKGYITIMYGTYSNPRDVNSQFIPDKTELIYSDNNGKMVVLGLGKLTVEEFRNFDFSEESMHKYFNRDYEKNQK